MDEKYWDELLRLLETLRADAVLRTRQDEAEVKAINERIILTKKMRLDSHTTYLDLEVPE